MTPRTYDLVPIDRFRAIVQRWLSQYEDAEQGFLELEAGSPYPRDTWQVRLSAMTTTGRSGATLARGWLAKLQIDPGKVDEFLTAAGLTELWYTELRDLLPPEERVGDEQCDATCACCGRWIDWSRGDAGVRVELRRPGKWREWWSVCSLCLVRKYPRPAMAAGASGNKCRIPEAVLIQLYVRYVEEQIGVELLAGGLYEAFGYASPRSCAISIWHAWRHFGWPTRSRWESKRLNGRHRHRPRLGRIPEDVLRKLHALHVGADMSANELGRQLFTRYGYATANSCAVAVADGWRAIGLQARDRIEMTVAVSTKDGLSPRDWRERKRRRLEAGRTVKNKVRNPACIETTRRGKPCSRPAMDGLAYCQVHDPARREELEERLRRIRAISPLHDPALLESIAPLQAELRACFEELGSWTPLAAATGIDRAYLSALSRDKRERIAKAKAAELRAAIAQVTSDELAAAA